jgi:hypothetical protein
MDGLGSGRVNRKEVVHQLRGDAGLQQLLGLPAHIGDGQLREFELVVQEMEGGASARYRGGVVF